MITILLKVKLKISMDIISFFSTIFISSAFLSITIFSLIMGFGPGSKKLKDPFQENEG